MIGDLSEIPEFSGDLDQLEKDAATLKKTASGIRDTGRDVHNDFQGLVSCYTAPEADQLFHTTAPVRDKADAFATKLETVSGALSGFAKDARPLVQRMEQLRSEAAAFRTSVEGDHDWRKDQKNIDKNTHLVHEIGRVWGEFQELERTTATKIDGQVGGTRWIADDGSHKKGMYGFKAEDAAKADDTPWGKVDDREYTGLAAAWHWTKHNVGGALKGFFVDGVWGTIKGLGHMVNVFDWDTFTKTWKGIGDVFGGISAYIMTPFDWAMDKMFGPVDHSDTDRQKKALRDFGKSLVAYDEWGTNPARAGGTVVFNVLTLGAGTALKLGKAGSLAAKTGEAGEAAASVSRVAKVADAFGKAGRLVDPMTYVGKGAGFAKLKVGDMMAGLRGLHSGAAGDFLHGTGPHTGVTVSDKSVRYPDGSILHENGTMTSPEGNPHQNPIPVESSAADRVARPVTTPPSDISSPSHLPVGADHPVPARMGGDGTEGVVHARSGSHAPIDDGGHGVSPSGDTYSNGVTPGRVPSAHHETSAPSDRGSGHGVSHAGSEGVPHESAGTSGLGDSSGGYDDGHVPGHGTGDTSGHSLPTAGGHDPAHVEDSGAAGQNAEDVARQHTDDRPGVLDADHGPHDADNWGHYKGEEVHYAQNPIDEDAKALRFYEDMRDPFSSRGNVETIAENTGMKPLVIQTAKENLFLQRHNVETELGVMRRNVFFTPDSQVADLWKKAEANKLSAMEQAQFRNHVAHEYVENKLLEMGMPYRSLDPRVWEGDSAYLSDHTLIGAHDVAPAALRATPMVTDGVGALSHWRRIGLEPPAEPILDDLSNVDLLVDSIKKGLNL
ncbi:hypothetical protein [Streptomyces murinus]|uniref:hypothetical protein n=1 Tax=Streptomyces murinus TaxID=33900 RepID=UPI003F460F79